MDIGNWGSSSRLYRQIRELGLERNVAELDSFGFTILEPGRAVPLDVVDRLRARMLEVAEDRTGVAHDIQAGTHGTLDQEPLSKSQFILYYLLLEDPVFVDAVLNPCSLALQTYLLGFDFRLSNIFGLVKWQDAVGYGKSLGLHADSVVVPQLMGGREAHTGNSTILLTDYTRENGALALVPGSHREGRPPSKFLLEGVGDAIPVEAPAGSMIVWNGNLWHGAYPRETPGLRLTLAMYFSRSYLEVIEDYRPNVSQEWLAQYPKRLSILLGLHQPWGITTAEGPRYSDAAQVLGDAVAEAGLDGWVSTAVRN